MPCQVVGAARAGDAQPGLSPDARPGSAHKPKMHPSHEMFSPAKVLKGRVQSLSACSARAPQPKHDVPGLSGTKEGAASQGLDPRRLSAWPTGWRPGRGDPSGVPPGMAQGASGLQQDANVATRRRTRSPLRRSRFLNGSRVPARAADGYGSLRSITIATSTSSATDSAITPEVAIQLPQRCPACAATTLTTVDSGSCGLGQPLRRTRPELGPRDAEEDQAHPDRTHWWGVTDREHRGTE